MDKQEYKKLSEEIIKELGEPSSIYDEPNECRLRLNKLKSLYQRSLEDVKRNRRIAETVKSITENASSKFLPVPEQIIRNEWLVAFNERQQRIVKQYFKNINQTPQQIAEELNMPIDSVKNTMSLEAFKMLYRHLTLGVKELWPLEASLALREVFRSAQDATKLKAAMVALMDTGFLKTNAIEANDRPEAILDADTEKRLFELGQQMRKMDRKEDK